MGALFHRRNDFVCDIGRCGMKSFERSAFEAVLRQAKGA